MHKAYFVSAIFNQNLIESIAAFENNIIIGTKIGQLFMYSMQNQDGIIIRKLEKYIETADEKPICQLKVVPEENLLFVLTNNGVISVYNIGGLHFSLIHSCLETRGCNIFDVDVKIRREGMTSSPISLCVAIKHSLKFFLWRSCRLQSLAKEIPLKDVPKAISWKDNLICIGFKYEYAIYNTFSPIIENNEVIVISSLNNIDPCITLIKKSVFGITKDDCLIFLDSNNLTEENQNLAENIPKPIMWSSSVFDLVWDEPYIIGRTANGVEVRVLGWGPNTSTHIQNMPQLDKVRLLTRSDSGQIFAASRSQVWYIKMVDIAKQLKEDLLPQKRFKLAIELNNMSKEPETSKMEANREIRIAYAKHLFENKKFLSAMDEFKNAEASPFEIVPLFPDSIKCKLTNTKAAISQRNMIVSGDKELENAILALIDYLVCAREKEMIKPVEGLSKSSLISFIDTTLLKCYLETNKDGLIVPVLRRKQCSFTESETTLKKYKKLNELLIHYQVNEAHEKALEFLKEQAGIMSSSFVGHDRIVKYLQNLGNDHKSLVFKFSEWVLHTYPEVGLKIFTDASRKLKIYTIPREDILDFLLKSSENSGLPYLEHIVHVWNDPAVIFHNELIKAYIEQIKKLNLWRMVDTLSENELRRLKSYRLKLNAFLRNSDKYSPEAVLQTLPSDYLFKERILVLTKMKEHQKVFVIYIQIQGNIEKAFKYCEKAYAQDHDIFEILLQTLLNPIKSSPYKGVELLGDFLEPNTDFVFQLLNKYASEMNLVRTYALLPENIKDRIRRTKK